jgi:VWFA-related protein
MALQVRIQPRLVGFASIVLARAFLASFSLAAEQQVQFVFPKQGEILVDRQPIELRLPDLAPNQIRGVQIRVDGRLVAQLTAAPWSTAFDFGDEIRKRVISATVSLVDGATFTRSMVVEPKGLLDVVDVPFVTLAVSVRDRQGKPLLDVEPAEVQVFDSGNAVTLGQWERRAGQLAVAIVLDTSHSMKDGRLEAAQDAANAFVRLLDPRDLVALIPFNDEPQVSIGLSANDASVSEAISKLKRGGGTALYDAVFAAASLLRDAPTEVRRVMVVLSDGRDEAASGLEPGSLHTLQEAIREAHLNDSTVFTIGLGESLDRDTDFDGRYTTAEILSRLASTTGGTYTSVTSSGRLDNAFRGVIEELRNIYTASYRMPQAKTGESWRTLAVKVARPGVSIRCREGYYVR